MSSRQQRGQIGKFGGPDGCEIASDRADDNKRTFQFQPDHVTHDAIHFFLDLHEAHTSLSE